MPNELVSYDIWSAGIEGEGGYKHVLVLTDVFTRKVVVKPLRTQTAEEVAGAFADGWVQHYGAPRRLLSDNGSAFAGKLLEDVCQVLKIKRIHTTPYNPRGNGMTERFNRTMADMLAKLVVTDQRSWPNFLWVVAAAYNQQANGVTGISPHVATFGREPPSILSELLYEPVTGLTDVGKEIRANLEIAWSHIRRTAEAARSKQEVEQARDTPAGHRVGDAVMVHSSVVPQEESPKLTRPWKSGFKVKKTKAQGLKSSRTVVVEDERMGTDQILNSRRVKPAPTPLENVNLRPLRNRRVPTRFRDAG